MSLKRKKKRAINFLLIILIGFILLLSSKEGKKALKDLIINREAKTKELRLEGTISLGVEDLSSYDNNIILWKDNLLTNTKIDKQIEWQREYDFINPRIYFGEKQIYIFERGLDELYLVNLKGEITKRIKLNMGIFNIIEDKGNLLVHIKDDKGEVFEILDIKGQVIEERQVGKQNILTYCSDIDRGKYALSTLDTEKGIGSTIQVYGLGGKHQYNAHIEDEIIMYMNFIDGDNLFIATDKGIYTFDYEHVLWKRNLQSIKDLLLDKDTIYLLYENILELISPDGRTIEKFYFNENYGRMLLSKKYLILYGERDIIGYKGEKNIFKYRAKDSISSIVQVRDKFLIVYEEGIDIMSLK